MGAEMFRLGEKQKLAVAKKVDFGVYLESLKKEDAQERVLLPAKQVPEGTEIGDILEVFLYKDSQDRLIATTNQPKLEMGQTALLTVVQVNKIGAFLDWGLEKDLFLPFKQQKVKVQVGQQVLVSLYIDKSSRLCATMNVYENLRTDSPYKKDDQVTGIVYEVSKNFGAFVAVDYRYSALIPKNEVYGKIEIGEVISARVTQVHEDGKLALSVREKAYLQMHKDADEVLKMIDDHGGVLPFNDKASPERIRQETGMSKNEFKRAVGNLLKAGKIQIEEKSIRRIDG
ncbi:MAG: S1-like domain-containing RNA-binding protein [Lachnoclostridium sp.]|nr:S1-like domain-containing RNA-binding protein [Lachnospira sp.]MCM1248832.1 S1-like domain-containing RNA-binding protein [Lachnoclostridium sp.]MCM1536732.1 S1-like domain-containing RNA-binding protein [Clostridium sp.]